MAVASARHILVKTKAEAEKLKQRLEKRRRFRPAGEALLSVQLRQTGR